MTSALNFQIDDESCLNNEELFRELGIDLNTAVDIFFIQFLHSGVSPFEVRQERSNKETITVMLEAGHQECHVLPDRLLIYRIEDNILVFILARTGIYGDRFGDQ